MPEPIVAGLWGMLAGSALVLGAVGLWMSVAVASGVAAALGNALLSGMDQLALAVAQSFAAGAIITMLADTMFPEAFESGGDRVGLATALGFATAFLLSRA